MAPVVEQRFISNPAEFKTGHVSIQILTSETIPVSLFNKGKNTTSISRTITTVFGKIIFRTLMK